MAFAPLRIPVLFVTDRLPRQIEEDRQRSSRAGMVADGIPETETFVMNFHQREILRTPKFNEQMVLMLVNKIASIHGILADGPLPAAFSPKSDRCLLATDID